ncbi:MAG: hypothetical protein ACJAYB_000058 [Psychromonas sp.]|jgi:hypothetical protein
MYKRIHNQSPLCEYSETRDIVDTYYEDQDLNNEAVFKKLNEQLKLYVWDNAAIEYGPSTVSALAHSVDEARDIITHNLDEWQLDAFKHQPKIFTTPECIIVWGGDINVSTKPSASHAEHTTVVIRPVLNPIG